MCFGPRAKKPLSGNGKLYPAVSLCYVVIDRLPTWDASAKERKLQFVFYQRLNNSCDKDISTMPPMQPQGSHLGLILPLCTSSATVGLAVFQYPVFLSFLQSKPSTAGRPLSRYWEPFLKQGGGLILGLGLTSSISGLVSWRWLQTHGHLETTAVSKWYSYGALFALAHFAFVPLVMTPIKNMTEAAESSKSEEEVDEANRKEMANWLLWHTVRTVVADIPALWCFAEGVALSFWVI
jgi:hypothetical protein